MYYTKPSAHAEASVNALDGMLNSSSNCQKEFCEAMSRQHRTIQQLFTKLCVAWLKHCASDEYRYDGRNEASHELGVKFVEKLGDDSYVPYI